MRRTYAQINPRKKCMLTHINTAWLYPQADVDTGLATTTSTYAYDGVNIKCPTLADIIGVYGAIFNATVVSQPIGNLGYTIGVGTLLEDMGRDLRFCLDNGQVVVIWRLVRQLTPQLPATVIPNPGNSPNGTIGYVTTFCSYGNGASGGYNAGLDDALVVSVG